MAVINILKNGTVVEDMSKVTVPETLVKEVNNVFERKEKENGN